MVGWVVECTARFEVWKVATPCALRVPVPMTVAPSRKLTVPEGIPLEAVTVAVKVTVWPWLDGLMVLAMTTEVATGEGGAPSTVWVSTGLVLGSKALLPL
jgi:hypothetical protein